MATYGGAACTRAGMHTLVAAAMLVTFTVVAGFVFGATFLDRVGAYLDVMDGEIVDAAAIYRNGTLHVRVNFQHVMGSGFDRVAVSEFVVGGWHVTRDSPDANRLDANHTDLSYSAAWGESCVAWNVTSTEWPATWPPASPATPCVMHVYQRIDDGDQSQELSLGGGNSAVLEFVLAGADPPANGTAGIMVQYGNVNAVKLSRHADVQLYVVDP